MTTVERNLWAALADEQEEREREQRQLAVVGRQPEAEASIQEKFEAFHAANPHVLVRLVEMARQARDAGQRRIGIGMLFEVLRWERMLDTTGDAFKLNNNYRSRYVRLIGELHPDLVEMFEQRELRS